MDLGATRSADPRPFVSLSKTAAWTLGLPIFTALMAAVLANVNIIAGSTYGFVRFVAYLVVSGFLVFVARGSQANKKLRGTALLLTALGFFPMLLSWTNELTSLRDTPILGCDGALHDSITTVSLMCWVVLPFMLLYRLIVSSRDEQFDLQERVRHQTLALKESSQRLSQEICDRTRIENELDQARRNLEAVAASRSDQLEKAQSQLVRQERMSALGKMATGIAHELNNTLSPVVAYSNFLKRAENLSYEQKEWVKYISQGAADAANVIRGLKKFHGSHEEDKREVIRLVPLVEQVIEMTRPVWRDAASADGKRVRMDLDITAEPVVLANAVELRQVLINLIINAAESLDSDGRITIEIDSEEGATILVRDTGGGMSSLEMERCFEPFYTSKPAGTGLGLSVCHGIIRDHGGTLSVQSELDAGTTFSVTLPIVREETRESLCRSESAADWEAIEGMTCLYVDDNEMLRRTFSSICNVHGVEITLASSAEEALTILEDQQFDLIVTDLIMGEMDGIDLIQEVRGRGLEVPIVLLTGWLEAKVHERLAGVIKPDHIMEKPATTMDYLLVFRQFAPATLEAGSE